MGEEEVGDALRSFNLQSYKLLRATDHYLNIESSPTPFSLLSTSATLPPPTPPPRLLYSPSASSRSLAVAQPDTPQEVSGSPFTLGVPQCIVFITSKAGTEF